MSYSLNEVRLIGRLGADPDVPTISKLLGCGPQTVRNRRNRAVKKLQEILGTEVKDVN